MDWIPAFQKVVDYMEEHLTDSISVDDIAKEVAISSFYLQKNFKILTNISISDYFRFRRLSLAGEELAEGDKKVIDIAYKYGYDTPESFSKAFYRFHGISPIKAKTESYRLKLFQPFIIQINIAGGMKLDYAIENKPELVLYGVSKSFCYENAYQEIPKFWDEIVAADRRDNSQRLFGRYGLSIENNEKTECFTYCIAKRLHSEEIPEGFEKIVIKEARWAVFRCYGPLPYAIQGVNTRIFAEWFPTHPEYEIASGINVEWYSKGNTKASDYYCEIWIPIQENK